MSELPSSPAYRERRITAQDGLSLYFRDYGDPLSPRPPLLCLTGLTRNSKDYHALASRLSAERRVICPDYRGRGQSAHDPKWRNYQPTTYLNDLHHILAALNLHRVVVVGTSLGAFLAMGLAVFTPGAVAGAVLNDAGPEVNAGGLARIMSYIGDDRPLPDWDAAIARAQEIFPQMQFADREGWRLYAESMFRQGADGQIYYDWDTRLTRPLRRSWSALPDLWPLFLALRPRPVLAIRGALSDILLPETFEEMGRRMPGLQRVTVPGVGHTPSLEEPEARKALDDFLVAF